MAAKYRWRLKWASGGVVRVRQVSNELCEIAMVEIFEVLSSSTGTIL